MPRLTVALAAVGVVALAGSATAAPARDAHASYTAPGGAQGVATVSVGGQGSTLGAAALTPQRGERWVTLRLVDGSGQPVGASVVQVLDHETGEYVVLGELCGPAPRAFRLRSAEATVAVRPVAGACSGAPSVPTQGTVTARFRR